MARVKRVIQSLKKGYEAMREDFLTPEEYKMGEEFENFVKSLFPEKYYVLVHQTHKYTENKERYIENSKEPDFKFRHKKSGHEFYIECKFRTGLYQDKFYWAKSEEQMKRYKTFQEGVRPAKVFIAGSPSDPERLFIVPLDDIKYPSLYPSFLKPYEVNPQRTLYYKSGKIY